jgi:hypothetical protein
VPLLDDDSVEESVRVTEGVPDAVLVPDAVPVPVEVGDGVGVAAAEVEGDPEEVPELDGVTPGGRLLVGDTGLTEAVAADAVGVPVRVTLGVPEGVAELLVVPVPEGVVLSLLLALGVIDALVPLDSDGVSVPVALAVMDAVALAVGGVEGAPGAAPSASAKEPPSPAPAVATSCVTPRSHAVTAMAAPRTAEESTVSSRTSPRSVEKPMVNSTPLPLVGEKPGTARTTAAATEGSACSACSSCTAGAGEEALFASAAMERPAVVKPPSDSVRTPDTPVGSLPGLSATPGKAMVSTCTSGE